jgi:DNA-binding NtrC family response regulator
MAELVFFKRGEEVLRFALDAHRIVIGRGESCDIVIPDPEVSRQQAAITVHANACILEDLSGRGTLVAGKRETSAEIKDGVDISFGPWNAVFRARTAADGEAVTLVESGGKTVAQAAEPARVAPAQVRLKQGTKETIHRLQSETFTVGKDKACDLAIDDKFLSARHIKVTRREGLFHIADLDSTNGTWLGNARVQQVEVPLFTQLRIGETELTLEPVGAGTRRDSAYFGIIGADPAVRHLSELIERVAPSQAAVTILGESGTGKELVARAVHGRSARADKPFIPVNCAAISKELIESELFGHEKGAFTGATNARKGAFEEADGGTLFLDEIGELPLDLQAKLLRALESGEIKRVGASKPQIVDVRIVAATNRDLLARAKDGGFREDLYYRLCVIPLVLPPLRNRRGDIVALAEHFVRLYTPKGQNVRMHPMTIAKLESHTWPGNIRELRNVIHRAMLLRKGLHIEPTDLLFDTDAQLTVKEGDLSGVVIPVPDFPAGTTLEAMLAQIERRLIEYYLRKLEGNRERLAKELAIGRSTLFKRLKEWGLTNAGDAE